jgi:hypothetical protein
MNKIWNIGALLKDVIVLINKENTWLEMSLKLQA